jgi:hypothetical protein
MLTIDRQGTTAAADRSTLVYAQSQKLLGSLVYSAVKNRNKQSSHTVLVLLVARRVFLSVALVMLCVAGLVLCCGHHCPPLVLIHKWGACVVSMVVL